MVARALPVVKSLCHPAGDKFVYEVELAWPHIVAHLPLFLHLLLDNWMHPALWRSFFSQKLRVHLLMDALLAPKEDRALALTCLHGLDLMLHVFDGVALLL